MKKNKEKSKLVILAQIASLKEELKICENEDKRIYLKKLLYDLEKELQRIES